LQIDKIDLGGVALGWFGLGVDFAMSKIGLILGVVFDGYWFGASEMLGWSSQCPKLGSTYWWRSWHFDILLVDWSLIVGYQAAGIGVERDITSDINTTSQRNWRGGFSLAGTRYMTAHNTTQRGTLFPFDIRISIQSIGNILSMHLRVDRISFRPSVPELLAYQSSSASRSEVLTAQEPTI